MFEAEEQIESRSYLLHLSIIVLVIVAIGAGCVYYYMRQQKPLTAEQASTLIAGMLNSRGSSVVHFHTGSLSHSRDDDPTNPQYKLLEKAGFIKTKPGARGVVDVKVTPLGESTFTQSPEFKKEKSSDGTEGYVVPLAKRELASVVKITQTDPARATVEYAWKWAPNPVGEAFDANGKFLKQFPVWERAILIQKHGADFYHAEPATAKVVMVRVDRKTWRLATE